jgi:hypothetical protein
VFAIIHEGLKIRRGQPRGGSTPPPGTTLNIERNTGWPLEMKGPFLAGGCSLGCSSIGTRFASLVSDAVHRLRPPDFRECRATAFLRESSIAIHGEFVYRFALGS